MSSLFPHVHRAHILFSQNESRSMSRRSLLINGTIVIKNRKNKRKKCKIQKSNCRCKMTISLLITSTSHLCPWSPCYSVASSHHHWSLRFTNNELPESESHYPSCVHLTTSEPRSEARSDPSCQKGVMKTGLVSGRASGLSPLTWEAVHLGISVEAGHSHSVPLGRVGLFQVVY